jgi:hypothetical protein
MIDRIGVTAARLHHADQQTATACTTLTDRIDALIRPA